MQIIGKTEQKRTKVIMTQYLYTYTILSPPPLKHTSSSLRSSIVYFKGTWRLRIVSMHKLSSEFFVFALVFRHKSPTKKKHRERCFWNGDVSYYFTTMLTSLFGTTITFTGVLPSMNFFAPSVARAAFSISALSVFGSTSSLSRILPFT